MVVRYIKSKIPSIEELGLPLLLKEFTCEQQELILIAGSTGSGKSTTLASMINYWFFSHGIHDYTRDEQRQSA